MGYQVAGGDDAGSMIAPAGAFEIACPAGQSPENADDCRMPATLETVAQEALVLPPDQRLALARRLLDSVDLEPEPGIAAAWEAGSLGGSSASTPEIIGDPGG